MLTGFPNTRAQSNCRSCSEELFGENEQRLFALAAFLTPQQKQNLPLPQSKLLRINQSSCFQQRSWESRRSPRPRSGCEQPREGLLLAQHDNFALVGEVALEKALVN
eukprot:TRINITY_DN8136_c0_g1_i1.p1 TRINITY_DN8136_c0_g1~~TRINITY_DN8136_c0_g1_i1.p1  ORF type:complete len:107 (+),score=8.97 TRINITY_DN8136_c0_g1_i1:398-718(+)